MDGLHADGLSEMKEGDVIFAMSEFIPINDLDHALIAMQKSNSALPALYRALSEGELWFLIPWHPEVEEAGGMELENGMPLPFSQIEVKGETVVPLFSSFERAREAMKKFRLPARTYSTAVMEAKLVLQILGATELRAVVNKGCKTGEVTIPPDLMRDLANGEALQPLGSDAPTESGKVQILDPSDYPTNLIQPAFEILRAHREFRAAWVFGAPGEPFTADGRPRYQVLVLMDPRDEVIFHDLNVVLNAPCTPRCEVSIGRLEEDDVEMIEKIFAAAPPFYCAADYRQGTEAEG